MNEPPPLNGDYNRDPNIKALKRRRLTNHGSTLGLEVYRLKGFLAKLFPSCAYSPSRGMGHGFLRTAY